jgi:hypothetical protein
VDRVHASGSRRSTGSLDRGCRWLDLLLWFNLGELICRLEHMVVAAARASVRRLLRTLASVSFWPYAAWILIRFLPMDSQWWDKLVLLTFCNRGGLQWPSDGSKAPPALKSGVRWWQLLNLFKGFNQRENRWKIKGYGAPALWIFGCKLVSSGCCFIGDLIPNRSLCEL